jgi:hypothetical protein
MLYGFPSVSLLADLCRCSYGDEELEGPGNEQGFGDYGFKQVYEGCSYNPRLEITHI